MSNQTNNQNQTSALQNDLNEIFMTPSNQMIADRFSPENQASGADCCGGKCRGGCNCSV